MCQRRYVCACERGGQRRYACACDRCVCAVCVNVGMCVRVSEEVNVGMCVRVIGVCVCAVWQSGESEVVGRRVGGSAGRSVWQSVGGSSPKSKNPTQ